jgi:hypothetical protein
MRVRFSLGLALAALLSSVNVSTQGRGDAKRDLQGLWTNGTATPLQRPPDLANKPFFTPSEAAEYERTAIQRLVSGFRPEDRLAPDLDETYLETHLMKVVGDLRTSLVVDPPDGRLPPLLPQAQARAAARPKPGFDDPETLSLDDRCLVSMPLGSSNAVPPMVPNPFGLNYYQIVQTPKQVLIHTELVHDARVIRINGSHLPATVQRWLGDSIGRWEGDTLVVDTTNFRSDTHFRGSGERLHVVERFTRVDANTIRYRVTAEDPDTWSTPWTAEIPFKSSNERIFEYACHEGNRSIENYMRGARDEERRGVRRNP